MLVECRYCSVCESFFDSVHEDCPYCYLYKSYDKLNSQVETLWKVLSEKGIPHNKSIDILKKELPPWKT